MSELPVSLFPVKLNGCCVASHLPNKYKKSSDLTLGKNYSFKGHISSNMSFLNPNC